MDAEHISRWTDALRRAGYRPADVLGSGMEGTVLDLGDDLVAKVWHRRAESELETLKTFYEAVAHAGPAIVAPRIHRVVRLDGHVATIEARLGGSPMWTAAGESPVLRDADVAAVLDVLAALGSDAHARHGDPARARGRGSVRRRGRAVRHVAGTAGRAAGRRFRAPLTARLPQRGCHNASRRSRHRRSGPAERARSSTATSSRPTSTSTRRLGRSRCSTSDS